MMCAAAHERRNFKALPQWGSFFIAFLSAVFGERPRFAASRCRWVFRGLHGCLWPGSRRWVRAADSPARSGIPARRHLPEPCAHRPSCARQGRRTCAARPPSPHPPDGRHIEPAPFCIGAQADRYLLRIPQKQERARSSSSFLRKMMMVFLVLMVLMVELLLPDWYQPVVCRLPACYPAC